MVDFHTHILPGIDDGCRDATESVQMLECLKEQGVNKVVLSPHFYAFSSRAESFVENREEALQKLLEKLKEKSLNIELYLGCEALYFNELWRMENLKDLSVKGTEFIMVEMPMNEWTDDVIVGMEKLTSKGLTPIIVHFERFIKFKKNLKKLSFLIAMGAQLQMNSSYIMNPFTRGKAISFFKKGMVSAIGSDCHDLQMRPPNCKDAYDILQKKLTKEQYNRFKNRQNALLKYAEEVYPLKTNNAGR